MSKIRSKDTKPEKSLRSALHKIGFRFRKNVAKLPGKPDVVMPKFNTVVFINGCFWHQHENCAPNDSPVKKYAYAAGFHDLSVRFIAAIKRIGDPDLSNLVVDLKTYPENIMYIVLPV